MGKTGNRETMGERVRRAREAAGYSTVRAAGRLDISQQSLKNKESGRTQFTPMQLKTLARIYHVDIREFYGLMPVAIEQESPLAPLERAAQDRRRLTRTSSEGTGAGQTGTSEHGPARPRSKARTVRRENG